MAKIIGIRLKGVYKIVWMRYVTGVDLSNHCMKSLRGHNDRRFKGYTFLFRDIELEKAKVYYFCAVEENWNWNKNIHIAFRDKVGERIQIRTDLLDCVIEDAELIPISDRYIDWSLPQSKNKLYNTCRNWWFANMVKNWFQEEQKLI